MIASALAWIGAGMMMLAPFMIDTTEGKLIAIVGLAFLCLQSIQTRCYNLTILNITGIFGYVYSIYF
jgi:hypothetical protein